MNEQQRIKGTKKKVARKGGEIHHHPEREELLGGGVSVLVQKVSCALRLVGVKCLRAPRADPSTWPSAGVGGGRGLRTRTWRPPCQDGAALGE